MDGDDDYKKMPADDEKQPQNNTKINKTPGQTVKPAPNNWLTMAAKPKPVSQDNCFVQCLKFLFKKMYPAGMKKARNDQSLFLRKSLKCATCAHIFFFIFSLAIVGFKPMIVNLALACWAYSCYLTFYKPSCILYIIFLFCATSSGVFYGMDSVKQGTQKIGVLANAFFYLVNIYYTGRAFYMFVRYGGNKPNVGPGISEPVALTKSQQAAKNVALTVVDGIEAKMQDAMKKAQEKKQAELLSGAAISKAIEMSKAEAENKA